MGGAIALHNGAQFNEDIVGIFMLMTFLIVGIVEISLCRQLSRITKSSGERASSRATRRKRPFRAILVRRNRALAEPVPSVTENTTRTLEYSRNEPLS